MTAKQQAVRVCLCGCGGQVGKRSHFVPGHDSKLHSRWLQVRRGESKEKLSKDQTMYAEGHWVFTPAKPKAPKAEKKVKAAIEQAGGPAKKVK